MTLVEIKLEKLQETYRSTESLKKLPWTQNIIISLYNLSTVCQHYANRLCQARRVT